MPGRGQGVGSHRHSRQGLQERLGDSQGDCSLPGKRLEHPVPASRRSKELQSVAQTVQDQGHPPDSLERFPSFKGQGTGEK